MAAQRPCRFFLVIPVTGRCVNRGKEEETMSMRKLLVGSILATTVGVALPAAARTNVDLYLNFGPPAPPVEYVPAPRPGWIWVPGVYEWRHQHYVWLPGHWEHARRGYYYAPSRWAEHDGRWGYSRGGWHRDSDHDGVPDRADLAPFNPYVR
jgi:hypothetical protein